MRNNIYIPNDYWFSTKKTGKSLRSMVAQKPISQKTKWFQYFTILIMASSLFMACGSKKDETQEELRKKVDKMMEDQHFSKDTTQQKTN